MGSLDQNFSGFPLLFSLSYFQEGWKHDPTVGCPHISRQVRWLSISGKPVVTSSLVEDWCMFKPVVTRIFQSEMVRC